MSLGFRDAGFRIAVAVEIDRNAAQTYRLNHPGVPVYEGAVEEITGRLLSTSLRNLGRPSVVIAGPPCQGYSAAGSRSADDYRNGLFSEVTRIADEVDAASVLIENVPGVRRVNGVSYTKRIIQAIQDGGYETTNEPMELRASDYGVPQHRRRLFFVGVRGEVPVPNAPDPTHVPSDANSSPAGRMTITPRLLDCLSDLPELGAGEGAERWSCPMVGSSSIQR